MITRAIWIGTALLGLVAGTGYAAEVDFGDLTDTLSVTLSSDLKILGFTTTFTGPETVVVSGTLPVTIGFVPPGPREVILTEPSSDTFNQPFSDLVFLDAEPVLGATGALLGTSIRIEFDSDLNGPVVRTPNVPVLGAIPETGASQDVGSLLGSVFLLITATSDLAGSEPTPLPASAWAGLALLGGLAGWRMVRRLKHTRA